MPHSKPVVLAISAGDPAGIGPDICTSFAENKLDYLPLIFADPNIIAKRIQQLKKSINIVTLKNLDHLNIKKAKANTLYIHPVYCADPVIPGKLDSKHASYVINALASASNACKDHHCQALVTAPINKANINNAGIHFSGHTEWLADRFDKKKVVMMLANEHLRVTLYSTHIPLNEVSASLNKSELQHTIEIIDDGLRNLYNINKPRIAVCGLNPHAGENGHLGKEEIKIISPVITELNNQGFNLSGPHPADSIFIQRNLKEFDAVLTMYHDQGLPVIKHQSFGEVVNITLGLPIIRTSVDHGTALELAASNKADPSSLLAACALAKKLSTGKQSKQLMH